MPPTIKICGLTRPEDIILARELGADYFGFIVYPKSPRAVSIDRAVELMHEVPEGRAVLVDVNTGTDDLDPYRKLGFGKFQIHLDLGLSLVNAAAYAGMVGPENLWLAPRLAPDDDFPQGLLNFAETFLLDAYAKDKYGGTGHTSDWDRYNDLAAMHPHKNWVLSGGLSPENVRDALDATGTRMIDLNSGVESAPGVKDETKLRALFAKLTP